MKSVLKEKDATRFSMIVPYLILREMIILSPIQPGTNTQDYSSHMIMHKSSHIGQDCFVKEELHYKAIQVNRYETGICLILKGEIELIIAIYKHENGKNTFLHYDEANTWFAFIGKLGGDCRKWSTQEGAEKALEAKGWHKVGERKIKEA